LARTKSVRRVVRQPRRRRQGKILVFFAVALPVFFAIVGLVFDAGLMLAESQNLKHAADAGATAAAMELLLGKPAERAEATAESYLRDFNGIQNAEVAVHIPPTSGAYAGREEFVEVVASRPFHSRFMHIAGAPSENTISARAVAGFEDSTAGAAIVVLDPDPPPISIPNVALTLPAFPAIVGGLEVLGLGSVRVDGAVLVNTQWGGVDEGGNPAGVAPGPPYGITCMPLVPLTSLQARDIRVAGGVDNPDNYGNFASGESSPLRANRLPVPDPYESLPVPTTLSDPANVDPTLRGGVRVVQLPLLSPPTVLHPGVYEWIEITSGQVVFEPGVYIIRGVNPETQIGLMISAGTVTANGVMFYLTNSSGYDAVSGGPDADDGESPPVQTFPGTLLPSAVINVAIAGGFSPLDDPGSPFHRLTIYQRRQDYRPIVIVHQNVLLGGSFSGTVYAKWGHLSFVGNSTYDCRFVTGSARLVAVTSMTIAPHDLLPPARDVFLVE
jgi:Flp pilus assembly protein TadG